MLIYIYEYFFVISTIFKNVFRSKSYQKFVYPKNPREILGEILGEILKNPRRNPRNPKNPRRNPRKNPRNPRRNPKNPKRNPRKNPKNIGEIQKPNEIPGKS